MCLSIPSQIVYLSNQMLDVMFLGPKEPESFQSHAVQISHSTWSLQQLSLMQLQLLAQWHRYFTTADKPVYDTA